MNPDHGADVERLASRARDFSEHAQRAKRIADDLRAAVDGKAPWGSDEIGERFAGAHVDAANRAMQRLEEISAQLTSMGDKFGDAAKTYRSTDDESAEGAARIDRELGEV
ncbi:hypothetical protein [Thermocrispum municipale]|jgi:methyl-accepting chemotaxis protein|uniref:hypothetical protein n=1 Tax=Thermocrispum municipale TaxID=37926 RepID=UPI000404B119|nr:hypothetical protein [Thermocrispum municipale]